MNRIFFLLLLMSPSFVHGQQPAYSWHHHLDGGGYEMYERLLVMSNGDVVSHGTFSGVQDFDPMPDTRLVGQLHGFNFISRTNGSGELQWIVNFDSTANLNVTCLEKDSHGDIYLCGYFYGLADFDPSPDTVILRTQSGGEDVFFARYSGVDGSLKWAHIIGSTQNDHGTGLCVAANGDVYVAGDFYSTMDVDPSAAVVNINSTGFNDLFLCRYDSMGNYLDSRTFGASLGESGGNLICDAANNLYLNAVFKDTMDVDPGPGIHQVAGFNNNSTGLLLKLDQNFQYINSIVFYGQGGMDISQSRMVFDGHGNLALSGRFYPGTMDMDGGAGTANLTMAGGHTGAYFTRQDSGLHYLSAFIIENTGGVHCKDIACDGADNIYACLDFQQSLDADPGPAQVNYSSLNNTEDMLICKYSPSGAYIWSERIAGGGIEYAACIARGIDQKIYAGGYFHQSIDVDPGSDSVIVLDPALNSDGILVCLDECIPVKHSVDSTICHGHLIVTPAGAFSEEGRHVFKLVSAGGCDSIVTLTIHVIKGNTEICVSDSSISVSSAGGTLQWISCNTKLPVPGATGSDFTVPDNNSYAVVITKNGCPDTSACAQPFAGSNNGQPAFDWANTMPYTQYTGFNMVKTGRDNHIYVTGSITDTANFDLLGGTNHYQTAVGGHKYLAIARYREDRTFDWAITMGRPESSGPYPEVRANAMQLDSNDNIYIGGLYATTFDMDPGPGVQIMPYNNGPCYFLAKYNASGNFQWAVPMVASGGFMQIDCIFPDSKGHIFAGGFMTGPIDFITPVGTTTLTGYGLRAMMLLEFDANTGALLNSFIPPAYPGDENGITGGICDHDGNIIVTGYFSNPIDFDPGAGTLTLNPLFTGTDDAFLVKYDSTLFPLWALKRNKVCSGETPWASYQVVVDCDNNIYASGSCGAYVTKYAPSGAALVNFGFSGVYTYNKDIDIDAGNNIYVATNFYDPAVIGTDSVMDYGGSDFIFSKFDSDGNFKWLAQLGSADDDYITSIDVDQKGGIYLMGNFADTLDADAGPGVYSLPNSYTRPYLIRYGESCTPVDTSVAGDSTQLTAVAIHSGYQWIDCATGLPVPGATGPQLTGAPAGHYRVIIYQGECADTSGCYYSISTLGIFEPGAITAKVSPNPVSGDLITVECNEPVTSVALYDLNGRLVENLTVTAGNSSVNVPVNTIGEGMYQLKIETMKGSAWKKLVKMKRD